MDNDYKNNRHNDEHCRGKSYKNKHGEEWIYKPPRKPKGKSYTALVLDYLREEWGLQQGLLSDESIERLMEMIDFAEYEGGNPANSAAMVMEMMWQNGMERPDFESDDTN